MRNIQIPRLFFGKWFCWDDRNSIDRAENPGVYILTLSYRNIAGKSASIGDAQYIGMTNGQKGLKGRWGKFHRAIHGHTDGTHSGGVAAYKALGHYDAWDLNLYVAALPVPCDTASPRPRDYLLMGAVAYLEYKAFAKFLTMRPRLRKPKFNTR